MDIRLPLNHKSQHPQEQVCSAKHTFVQQSGEDWWRSPCFWQGISPSEIQPSVTVCQVPWTVVSWWIWSNFYRTFHENYKFGKLLEMIHLNVVLCHVWITSQTFLLIFQLNFQLKKEKVSSSSREKLPSRNLNSKNHIRKVVPRAADRRKGRWMVAIWFCQHNIIL